MQDLTDFQVGAIEAFMFAESNLVPREICRMAYPQWDELDRAYQDEKLGILSRHGILVLFSQLDAENRKRLVRRLVEHYKKGA